MIGEVLFETKTCGECSGVGSLDGVDCPVCHGAGVQIDNDLPDIIKRFHPLITRRDFVQFLRVLMATMSGKLADAYERGRKDEGEARDTGGLKKCPSHENGEHDFIPCDDLPATCLCGKTEAEA